MSEFRKSSKEIMPKVVAGLGMVGAQLYLKNRRLRGELQRINDAVFKTPKDIAANISLVANYLRTFHPDYLFVSPTKTRIGEEMIYVENEGYFRMFPFVEGSHSKDVVETPEQAYEAAAQFGKFTKLLSARTPSERGRIWRKPLSFNSKKIFSAPRF